ncbi:endonuclease/exonuclease/phosphatase family protein [Streptomyces sp. NPDC005423]|uniref:endonuclease/exonuclease/phosphatase family protein n=1 Tax=Streptomyces sp. NPDC005423 TaxID=3155343 RepID=UPI0033AC155B
MGDTRVRCATFNVLHGRRIQGDGRPAPGPADAALPLAEAVASLDADVIALQEVDRLLERSGSLDQAAVAAAAAGADQWRYASALHCRSVPGGGWVRDPAEPGLRVYGPLDTVPQGQVPSHGVALLTRLPVREWRALRLSPAPFGLPLRVAGRRAPVLARDQPRAALAAVLEGRRGPFTAVALHLSFVPGWSVGQLLAVRRWIAALPAPHVLLGDFNLIGAIPRLTLNTAERAGTWPLRAPAAEGSAARVWRTPEPVRTFPSHRPLVQLDHILTAGLGHEGLGPARAPRTPISDHRPLIAELAL